MAFDRFLIAPFNTGLQTNLRPFLILDDAFEYLQNAYVFRGRIRKRFGSRWMGTTQLQTRLRINIGTVAAHTIPGGLTQLQIGAAFSVGNDFFTVFQLGAGVLTLSTNAGATATIDTTANPNTVVFVGEPAGSTVYYYPANSVMGITQYLINDVNNHPTYAFDTQFAYKFISGSGWERSGTAIWHGTNLNYFWETNWKKLDGQITLYVTNFNFTLGAGAPAATDDPIWYMFPQDTWTAMLGSSVNGIFFLPAGGARTASPFVQTALIILPFKGRLVLFNTVENDNSGGAGSGTATQFKNRARWSFYGDPTALNAWYEPNQTDAAGNVAAGGDFQDAPTDEAIVSAQFIKDRLIVYFERSTWEFAYTGNQQDPFVWQKLNTELGSQSLLSTVARDKEVITVGNTGIHASNGSNVQRIDEKIPQKIFTFKTENNATRRTAGIIDYINEMIYWVYVSDVANPTQAFANQIMAYNYRNGSWAFFDDCFTVFGYVEQLTDMTWASSVPLTWENANDTWISNVIVANQRQIIAGTPEGFVVTVVPDDLGRNAPTMQITNVSIAATGIITITAINHNLTLSGEAFGFPDYVLFENFSIALNPLEATFLNGAIFPVFQIIDANTFTINTYGGLVGPEIYVGGATITRVSNVQLLTKQYNPYDKENRNVTVQKVDFAVQRTGFGQITVDYYPSATDVSMIAAGEATGTIMGTSVLETSAYDPQFYPLEQFQQRLWHPIYFAGNGECIQLAMYFSPQQITNPNVSLDDFVLEGMTLYTKKTSDRME